MFSARHIEAEEAYRMGLINFVIPRDDIERQTIAYAQKIAANAPLTVKAAKAAINTWERGSREEEVLTVNEMVRQCFDSEDYKEGRRAFGEKRTPDFQGR
jgi:1,4-dihydroxy-2-naphthoyl-CoA synthase